MNKDSVLVNGKRLFAFSDSNELIHMAEDNIYISLGAESLMSKDFIFTEIINKHIGYADGEAAVYALKKKGYINAKKIPGCELWLEFLKAYSDESIAIIGAGENVLNDTIDKISKDFPNINVKYSRNGFFNIDESYEQIIAEIIRDKPKIVIIAMGQPQQEMLAERMFNDYRALYLCVGGSLDVYTGVLKRAPKILINLKLEWCYRLISQPKRILRQMVIPKFLFNIFINKDFIK